jgi:hypothetical protein
MDGPGHCARVSLAAGLRSMEDKSRGRGAKDGGVSTRGTRCGGVRANLRRGGARSSGSGPSRRRFFAVMTADHDGFGRGCVRARQLFLRVQLRQRRQTLVLLTYKTRFARGGGIETFVYERGTAPRLIGYQHRLGRARARSGTRRLPASRRGGGAAARREAGAGWCWSSPRPLPVRDTRGAATRERRPCRAPAAKGCGAGALSAAIARRIRSPDERSRTYLAL